MTTSVRGRPQPRTALLPTSWEEPAQAIDVPYVVEDQLAIPTKRRRDPHNSTLPLKRIIDALMRAGAWKDDNADRLDVRTPTITRGGEVVVRISA